MTRTIVKRCAVVVNTLATSVVDEHAVKSEHGSG